MKKNVPKKQLVMEEEVRFMDEGHRYSLFLMMLDELVKPGISGCSIEMAVSILMKELAKAGSDLEDELPFH